MVNVRKGIDDAVKLYDAGNWQLSVEKLEFLIEKGILAGEMQKHEIEVLISWNWWKMGRKQDAVAIWKRVIVDTNVYGITLSSAHAGLSIYYAEIGNREEALKHAQFAQDFLSGYATVHQNKTLNSCGITLANIGELKKAEEILQKVSKINKQLINSIDPKIAKEATHQRGKNGYNLASLVYIPQERFYEAIKELEEEVIPCYEAVKAETDLAAAYHRVAEVNEKIAGGDSHLTVNTAALNLALSAEEKSLTLWRKHPDDPKRIETAQENIKRIENKMREQE